MEEKTVIVSEKPAGVLATFVGGALVVIGLVTAANASVSMAKKLMIIVQDKINNKKNEKSIEEEA